MHKSTSSWLLVIAFTTRVSALGTNVTCLPSYGWMNNTRRQNPCLLSSYLDAACLPDPVHEGFVGPLPTNIAHYNPPVIMTNCTCSTVLYSALAACASCQGAAGYVVPWSIWSTNCSTRYPGVWAKPIPGGTAIPVWAYMNVQAADTFNVTAAQQLASESLPDSTAVSSMTVTASPTAPNAALSSVPPKRNAAAIVGGVLGGVVLFLATVIIVMVVRRRKARLQARHSVVVVQTSPPSEKPPVTMAIPRYNPDNPLTFPAEL